MNDEQALVLITKAGLVDARMKRNDPTEKADMAEAWAAVLHDVDLADAIAAVNEFYRSESGPIMPADIIARTGRAVDVGIAALRDVDPEWEAETRARALEAAGVSEAELAAHEGDTAWLRARFAPVFEIESPLPTFYSLGDR